jgi:hypothetical protein
MDGRWGYLDKSQNYVIKPQFDWAERFSEGLALVGLRQKFGFIDTTGKFVIEPQFAYARSFSEGLALVFPDWGFNVLGHTEGYTLFVRAGYVDHTGKMAIKPRFVEDAHSFSDGLAAFKAGIDYGRGEAKWGFLAKNGKWAISPQFDLASDFSEEVAAVKVHIRGQDLGQWGYIDKAGKFVIPAKFDKALSFVGGLARVETKDGWRYIDKHGAYVRGDFTAVPGPVTPHGLTPIPH